MRRFAPNAVGARVYKSGLTRTFAPLTALIYPSAAKAGLPVLTANRDEFDIVQQIAPGGQFIHF